MATTALFSCTLLYAVNAYRFLSHGALALLLGVGLGVYALALYVAMGALAIYTMRWAWRVAVAAFGLHIAVGLVLVSTSSPLSGQDLLSLTIYFAIGAIGLWATLHSGTRAAVTAAHATRVE